MGSINTHSTNDYIRIYTDSWNGYNFLYNILENHIRINHAAHVFRSTNHIESTWS